jgi:protein-disulfide isomerase
MPSTKTKHSSATDNSLKKTVILTTIIITVVVVLFLIIQSNQQPSSSNTTNMPDLTDQPVQGNPDAKVTIVEFGDYKCPGCKAWSQQFYPEVKKRWIDTGIAKFAFIHVNFHGEESKFGSTAGEALWAQQPDAFWPFMKSLYDRQPESADHYAQWITEEVVRELAIKSAPTLDVSAWQASFSSELIQKRVKIDEQLVEQFQIQKTPTIIINGTTLENPFDMKAMESLINKNKE